MGQPSTVTAAASDEVSAADNSHGARAARLPSAATNLRVELVNHSSFLARDTAHKEDDHVERPLQFAPSDSGWFIDHALQSDVCAPANIKSIA